MRTAKAFQTHCKRIYVNLRDGDIFTFVRQ